MTDTPTPGPVQHDVPDVSADIAYYTNAYITIRDKKAAIKKRHAEELAPYNTALDTLEAGFIQFFLKTNTDNTTSKGVGNVYRNVRKSAVIEDMDAFKRHVIGAELWDLLDIKANAPSVKEAITATGADVPGVKYSETLTIGVRKA